VIDESATQGQDARVRRQCGECTLCCRLLPIQPDNESGYTPDRVNQIVVKMIEAGVATRREFAAGMLPGFRKPAGERCPHQRHNGCAVYARRPFGCHVWNCRWLGGVDVGDLSRPDRAGYVIDIMPDFVTLADNETGVRRNIEVVQIWVDHRRRDAWRHDKKLMAFLQRRGREGIAAIIRFDAREAVILFPPATSSDDQWHEINAVKKMPEHRDAELMAGLAQCRPVKLEVAEDD
jgi:Putative zinc- or iron-chelating domain